MVYIQVALRNLLRNRRRTLLTLCTMVFGLLTLALVRGYANAVQKVQLDSTVYGTTGMLQVYKRGFRNNVLANPLALSFEDTQALRAKISAVEFVTFVSPRLVVSGLLSLAEAAHDGGAAEQGEAPSSPVNIIAIEPETEAHVSPELFKWIDRGAMLQSAFAPGLVLSSGLAASMGVVVQKPPVLPDGFQGLQADLLAHESLGAQSWPVIMANDVAGNINGVTVLPVGTLSAVLPGDKRIGFINLRKAQELLRMDSKVTSYVISLSDVAKTDEVKAQLESVLGSEFEVVSWDEAAPFVKDLLHNVDLIFVLISGIFVLVVALGVANSILMTVMERKQEIGTIMAMGGTRLQIASFFTLEGFFMGLVGGCIGTVLGYLAVLIVHDVGIHLAAPGSDVKVTLRTFVSFNYLWVSFVFTALLSGCVSVWPALRATAQKPIEVLKSA